MGGSPSHGSPSRGSPSHGDRERLFAEVDRRHDEVLVQVAELRGKLEAVLEEAQRERKEKEALQQDNARLQKRVEELSTVLEVQTNGSGSPFSAMREPPPPWANVVLPRSSLTSLENDKVQGAASQPCIA